MAEYPYLQSKSSYTDADIETAIKMINEAKKPYVYVGGGGDVAPNGTRGVRNAQAVLEKYRNKIRLANLNDYPFWNS